MNLNDYTLFIIHLLNQRVRSYGPYSFFVKLAALVCKISSELFEKP